jgi:hypothetical protein
VALLERLLLLIILSNLVVSLLALNLGSTRLPRALIALAEALALSKRLTSCYIVSIIALPTAY